MITTNQRTLIASAIGEEISKHRRLMKLSQKNLALCLEMKVPQLCKIEKGKTLPGEDILMKIEHALGLNPCSLVELRSHLIESYEDPTEKGVSKARPRLEPLMTTYSVSDEELDLLAQDILSKLDDYLDLEDELKIPHFCRIHLGQLAAESAEDGMNLAHDVRFRLDIGNAPLHTMLPILEQFNIRIVFVPSLPPIRLKDKTEKTRAALTFIDTVAQNPVICVNEKVSPESQLYHIAYELGSYFQTRHAKRTHRSIEGDGSTFARAFASTLLMPVTAIRDLVDILRIENDAWTPTLLAEVSRRFGVSTRALLWRLASIGRIDRDLFVRYCENPPDKPYVPAAPLPHDVWLKTLESRAKGT